MIFLIIVGLIGLALAAIAIQGLIQDSRMRRWARRADRRPKNEKIPTIVRFPRLLTLLYNMGLAHLSKEQVNQVRQATERKRGK